MPRPRGGGLTNKQRVFVEYYLVCWNATEAARRAGYTAPDCQGPENLRKPLIQALIKERISQVAMSADEVLLRLASHARGNVIDLLDESLRLDREKVRQHGSLVKKIKWTEEGPELELYDAQAALVHLGRHHKLFPTRTEISGPDGGPIPLSRRGLSDDELEHLARHGHLPPGGRAGAASTKEGP